MQSFSTPWPIEKNLHPSNVPPELEEPHHTDQCKAKVDSLCQGTCDQIKQRLVEDPEQDSFLERFAERCFKTPQFYRDMILKNVKINPAENFDGGSVFYMWMNKSCPVGCDFCFFQSPKNINKVEKGKTEITPEGIDRLVKFINAANIKKFVISGGGEPMLKRRNVECLVENVDVDDLTVVTSGFWAEKSSGAKKAIDALRESQSKNPNQPNVVLRLSLDKDHFEKLSKGKGFGYVHNIIDELSVHREEPENPQFLIHTVIGDGTIDQLLAELSVKTRVDSGDELNKKSEITLEDGFKFKVEYSQIFQSDTSVNMHNRNVVDYNVKTFQDFVTQRRNGNMSLSFHGKDPKGVYYLMLYDGTILVWGATAPDNEASLYTDDYDSTMKKNLGDVLTLCALEKGTFYRENVVSEVNSVAVERARAMGIRDFHSRVLLEEDATRLFASVRTVQDYMSEGRISQEEIQQWPAPLRALISMPKEKLTRIYKKAGISILDQYLSSPNLSVESLFSLYEMVKLGHYDLTVEEMFSKIETSNIDEDVKMEFFKKFRRIEQSEKTG